MDALSAPRSFGIPACTMPARRIAPCGEWIGSGSGIHWPLLDEDLSIKGMLEGNPSFEYGRQPAQAVV